jgi:arylsulfatase A-like enzyme
MRRLAASAAVVLLAGCPGRGPAPTPSATTHGAGGSGLSVLLVTIDTLRADHLGAYGYRRPTSPRLDAFAATGALFEQAYTYWPKTRGSFVMIMTGKRPSQNGYSKTHPGVVGFNPTIASALKQAGYRTAASVDNPNVARIHGYAAGFDRYRETWEEKALATEWDRTRAISDDGVAWLAAARPDEPFFLWLHYVNPHAPYAPPAPWDGAFAPDAVGPRLPIVESFRGGIPRQWVVAGKDRLSQYVALYDGEIAAVDSQVGRVLDALSASRVADRTLVVVTSDHGESLGEHDYYFDHGEDLFDPCLRIPLLVRLPGAPGAVRSAALVSTLDLMPTILDAVQVRYPPDLAGTSLLPAVRGGAGPARDRLYAQNERHLSAALGVRHKIVATPAGDATAYALYDRAADPGETRDVSPAQSDVLRTERRELELFLERSDREWAKTRPLLGEGKGEPKVSGAACEQLRALGYVQQCSP